MKNFVSQPAHKLNTSRATSLRGLVVVSLTLFALSACSPGGVVAGTVGAAGVVAGTAVDLVLKGNSNPGVLE